MRFARRLLLASVSVVTLLAGGLSASWAQDETKFILGVSGGLISGPNLTVESFVESGAYDINEIDIFGLEGDYYAVTVGTKFMPLWDFRARLASTRVDDTYSEFEYLDVDQEEQEVDKLGSIGTGGLDYQTLDIEAGYTPAIADDFELRFVAGVRAMHYTDRLTVEDKIGEEYERVRAYENEYFGIGPRVGLEASARLGDTGFGVSASGAASLVFGTLERSTTVDDDDTTTSSVDKNFLTLEAKATADYYLGDFGKVSLGYRAERLSGVHDFRVGGVDIEADAFTHGPVLELLGSF